MANMLALLLGLASVMSIVKTVTALTTPVVSVEPETTDWTGKPLNGTFMVSVNVNSPDIFIWSGQIGISFNASVLECVSFGKGSAIDPTWLWMAGTVRNDLGYVTTSTWSCITGQEPGWVGNGAFIVYTFRVKSLGNCMLHPENVQLNAKDGGVHPISPIIVEDGYFIIRSILGDINHDGVVDSTDFGILGNSWSAFQGEPLYNPDADLNGDGEVDSADLGIMGAHRGAG